MKKIYLLVPIVGLMATAAYAATASDQPFGQTTVGVNSGQYHSYDGLICTDCHTLHNSEDGAAIGATGYSAGGTNRELLKRGDWTDMCLSCHKEGQNTSATAALVGVEDSGWTAPAVMSANGTYAAGSMPAGDFYYSNLDPKKGHNPAFTKGSIGTATSKFMAADPTLGSTPPGGTITDGEWSCHSCHGMHARFSGGYTAYRQIKRKVNGVIIAGCNDTRANGADSASQDCDSANNTTATGYEAIKSNTRGSYDTTTLDYVAARADGHVNEGASLWAAESDTNKNVYRGGFSSFCSACHGAFHGGNDETRGTANGKTNIADTWQRHPTNVKMNETAVVMNGSSAKSGSKYGITTYTKQVVNKQGTQPNPVGYDWRYPLVQPDTDFTVAAKVGSMTTASTAIGDSRIMCLTCHKAHASQFENMTRWDTNAHSFIANGATDFAGVVQVGDNPAYGCGKCHQKGGVKAFVKAF